MIIDSQCRNVCHFVCPSAGVDARRMVHDGWPSNQVLAVDSNPRESPIINEECTQCSGTSIEACNPRPWQKLTISGTEWFDLGWQLFQDKKDTQIRFISCDLLATDSFTVASSRLGLDSPDRVRIRAISAFALFHLYSEEHQAKLALTLWNLLDKTPGNIIFGLQKGMTASTQRNVHKGKEGQDVYFW